MMREMNLAYWKASISGRKEDFDAFARLKIKLKEIYARREDYARIAKWKDQDPPSDPLAARQLELLHIIYLKNQIDPALNRAITKLATEIENKFNVHRPRVGGKQVTNNQISRILKESKDSDLRKHAWEAGKEVGAEVVDELISLVRMRNLAARALGYDDYFKMSLALGEQDEGELVELFDHLDSRTRGPFTEMKKEMDDLLAARHGISPRDLRPWHYEDPFFQRAPSVYEVDLDRYYEDQDIVSLVDRFYSGIGIVVRDIIERSDLYEKPGKEPHAYCIDIDRRGDVRVLANISPDENWTGTMLHELGHAAYDKHISPSLPFFLRQAAHTFTTEAVAMLFGRLSKSAEWIKDFTGMSEDEMDRMSRSTRRNLRLSQLVFARWCQVMFRFERELYRDPDRDLNRLWWELVEEYQMITPQEGRNEPDWATKIHIVSVPVYYHNYMLGEILASQLNHYIQTKVLESGGDGNLSYNGKPEVGEFLMKKVFSPGARYRWDEMVEIATGEKLTPAYFLAQFVD